MRAHNPPTKETILCRILVFCGLSASYRYTYAYDYLHICIHTHIYMCIHIDTYVIPHNPAAFVVGAVSTLIPLLPKELRYLIHLDSGCPLEGSKEAFAWSNCSPETSRVALNIEDRVGMLIVAHAISPNHDSCDCSTFRNTAMKRMV